MPLSRGRPIVSGQIINLDNMDAATCTSLKGKLNERGQCLVDAHENPEDPETLVLKAMKYKPAIKPQQNMFQE